jgi:hypothetical protein
MAYQSSFKSTVTHLLMGIQTGHQTEGTALSIKTIMFLKTSETTTEMSWLEPPKMMQCITTTTVGP